ncbi:MAG TPA: hydroxyacid dehydrogenase [Planctomycetota bacterium]|nr:hydroxyacid dehydrogenase [Planctomycetota bacterium]
MKPKGLFILDKYAYDVIYGPEERAEIARLADIYAPQQTAADAAANPAVLRDAEVIFSGWGGPKMDDAFLASAPRLKAVFYGAGSIRYMMTDAFWIRGIAISSAYGVLAVSVGEFALAGILFSLKRGWHFIMSARRDGKHAPHEGVAGAFGSTVGIISLGMVGRRVCGLLKQFDLRVLAYDPFADARSAAELGVELCPLDELFRRSDVVSLHTPWLKETEGMITGEHLRMMKRGSTFINTSRGAIVREDEMIEALRARPDVYAVLDVTHPEPPVAGSPLWTLPNVVLTPHVAGPMEGECRRMGQAMISELKRFIAGEKLQWGITREMSAKLA